MSRWIRLLAASLVAVSLASVSAQAQSGPHKRPGAGVTEGKKIGRTPPPPNNPPYVPPDTTGGSASLPPLPLPPPLPPTGGPPSTPTTPTGNPNNPVLDPTRGFDRWDLWWELNKFSYLEPPKLLSTSLSPRAQAGLARIRDEQLLPACRTLVTDGNPGVRAAAAIALGKLRQPQALPAILVALHDDNPRVREAAILALGISSLPEAASILFDIVSDTPQGRSRLGLETMHVFERSFAAFALGLHGSPVSTSLLEASARRWRMTSDLGPMATQALGLAGGDRSPVAVLLGLLDSPRSSILVRSEAYVALGRLGDPAGLGSVLRGVIDARSRDRVSAVIAAGQLSAEDDPEAARRLVYAWQQDADTAVRTQSAIALGRLGGAAARKALLGEIQNGNDFYLPWAALGLGILAREAPSGDPRVQEILRDALLRERSSSTRGAISIALGISRDREATRELLSVWRGKGDPLTRGHAAVALAMIGARETTEELERELRANHDPRLVSQLALALALLGEDSSLKPLLDLLVESRNATVQSSVAIALGLLGHRGSAQPLLRVLTRSKAQDSTRAACLAALGLLFDPEPVPLISRITRDSNYHFPTPAFRELTLFLL